MKKVEKQTNNSTQDNENNKNHSLVKKWALILLYTIFIILAVIYKILWATTAGYKEIVVLGLLLLTVAIILSVQRKGKK